MSLAPPAKHRIDRPPRARVAPAAPLVARRQQHVLLLLAAMLLLGGTAAGLVALLRPAPRPQLAGLWILSEPSQHGQRQAALSRDREALLAGEHFQDVSLLPIGTPTLRQTQAQLNEWRSLRPRESVVVYLAACATVDDRGQVQLPLGSSAARDSLPLGDVLVALRDSPARRTLLVLDLARDADDAIWPHATGEVATAIEAALSNIPDPRRLVISSCSPGQTPRLCEVQGRTLFGESFEHALAGAADGAIDERRNGRVTVAEIAAFVGRDVAERAAVMQHAAQTPCLFGDGDDFDVSTVSLRSARARHAAAAPIAARDYPKWLAAAWAQRDRLAASGKWENCPRLQRRWEQTLLRAEGQWRGGRDAKAVEHDLTQHLAALTTDLQCRDEALAAPPPHSLAALRAVGEPKDFKVASKAVAELVENIAAKTAGLADDKALAVRRGLVQDFVAKTQKLDAGALALAIVDRLTADDEPTADDIALADELLRARSPQPAFVETLFVRRLHAALALDPSLSPGIIGQALRVQRKGEQAALGGRSFAWAADELTRAAQQRYDGEYLLLHTGLAPLSLASERLARAERSYDRVLAQRATVDAAYEQLAAASLMLPVEFNQLPTTPAAHRQWLDAAQAATALADALQLPRPTPASGDELEQVRRLTLQATAALDELRRPLSAESLAALVSATERDDADASTWMALDRILDSPRLSSPDRQRLWKSFKTLNVRKFQECGGSDEPVSELPPRSAVDDLAAAHGSLALLRLGGVAAASLAPYQEELRQLADDRAAPAATRSGAAREIQQALRAEYQRVLGGALAAADAWTRARAASIVPALRELAWLDALDRDPAIALRRGVAQARWEWLASEYRYRAHDDTTQLNSEIARRYGALANEVGDAFIRFAAAKDVARPSSASPDVATIIHWDAVGILATPLETTQLHALSPHAGLVVEVHRQATTEAALAIRGAVAGDVLAGRGVLIELTTGGRTWHQPLVFAVGGPSTALNVVISTTRSGPPSDVLRVRPSSTPQPYYLAIENPTAVEQQVVIEVPGVGQTTLTAPAGQTSPVILPPAPAQPDAAPVRLDGALEVMLRDAATQQTLGTESYPIEVVKPSQYVRVLQTRFDPGRRDGKSRLSITLAASQMPPGPPCMVELVLSPEQVPGLIGVTGGRLRGELLPDGTPLVLAAEGLQLIDGAEEQGEFCLSIDGVERAMTFAADFARRGDATTPRQIARPKISASAPQFAQAGPNFAPTFHATQGPADAKIELRVGRLENGVLVSQLVQSRPTPREDVVDVVPAVSSTFALAVSVRDWQFQLDATGMVGPRTLEAALTDAGGRRLSVARQSVTFDGTPPESAVFFQLRREALVQTPIDLQVLAADSVSGIDKVFVFSGRPIDGEPPPGAKLIEATRAADGGMWSVQLPPVKDIGPCDIGVQAVNRVGLATCASETVQIVEQLATAGGSIAGTVTEGDRPQPQLEVQLRDAASAVIATMKTDAQGAFAFTDLKPGSYTISAMKASSQRQAKAPVALDQGQAASVQLELSL